MLTRDSRSRLLRRALPAAVLVVGVCCFAWTLDLVGLNSPGVARRGERTPHDVFDRARISALILTLVEPQRFRAESWSPYEAPGP